MRKHQCAVPQSAAQWRGLLQRAGVPILIEHWRKHYNTKRPHGALGCRQRVLETIVTRQPQPTMPQHSNRTAKLAPIDSNLADKFDVEHM